MNGPDLIEHSGTRHHNSFDDSSHVSATSLLSSPRTTTSTSSVPTNSYDMIFKLFEEQLTLKTEIQTNKKICENFERSVKAAKEKIAKTTMPNELEIKCEIQALNLLDHNLTLCKKGLLVSENKLKETFSSFQNKRKKLLTEYTNRRKEVKKEIYKKQKAYNSNKEDQNDLIIKIKRLQTHYEHARDSYGIAIPQNEIKSYEEKLLELQENFTKLLVQIEVLVKENEALEYKIEELGGIQQLKFFSLEEFNNIIAQNLEVADLKIKKKKLSQHKISISNPNPDEKKKFVAIATKEKSMQHTPFDVYIVRLPCTSLQNPSKIDFYIDTKWTEEKGVNIRSKYYGPVVLSFPPMP